MVNGSFYLLNIEQFYYESTFCSHWLIYLLKLNNPNFTLTHPLMTTYFFTIWLILKKKKWLGRDSNSRTLNQKLIVLTTTPWKLDVEYGKFYIFKLNMYLITIVYIDRDLNLSNIILKLMYLQRFWTGIVLGIVIVVIFESFFFALLASVSLGNKNGCKCQHYDYA